jgi:ribA/ribD-fused uncharacterized protein
MAKGVIRFYDPDAENGYLSNWYRADFTYAGRHYSSVEQYMMLQKALTFGDTEIAEQIEAEEDLQEIKRLGRMVARYNDSLWKAIRVQILRRGIRAKFQQNPRLLCDLLATGNALLAECAPRDLVWGIGIDMEDSRSGDPKEWKGRNLLGRTLMRVREDLRAWCSVAGTSVSAYEDAVDLRVPRPVKPSRRSDSAAAERIRQELRKSFGEDAAVDTAVADVIRASSENSPADAGKPADESQNRSEESSVWNMHIYEAVMLPYLSEIVSTWLEEVMFNLRRSRSYEDLGVSNYTFEELEWMIRNGQSAGLPTAGFFEMKQDIFDLMRYQGGLRNPAALLAQVDRPEPEEPELLDTETEDLAVHEPDEHITVAFRPREDGTMVTMLDPGTTSAPETYVTNLPSVAGEPASYTPETGEEAKTSIGSTPVDSRPASELWNDLRKLAGEDEDEPEEADAPIVGKSTVDFAKENAVKEDVAKPAVEAPAKAAEAPAQPVKVEKPAEPVKVEKPVKAAAAATEPAKVAKPAAPEKPAAVKAPAKPAEPAAEAPAKTVAAEPVQKKQEQPAAAATVKPAETPKKPAEAPKASEVKKEEAKPEKAPEAKTETKKAEAPAKPAKSAAEASILKRTAATAKASNDVEEPEEPAAAAKKPAAAPKPEAPKAEPKKEEPKAETKEEPKKEEPKAETEAEPKKEEPKPEVKPEAKPAEAAAAAKPAAAQKTEAPKKTYRDEVRSEIVIKHGNIVALACDAIVNATTNTLLGGPGTDNTILRAGGPELLRECAALKGCDVGRAKISRGYRLKAGYVIHTVGPKYSGDDSDPVYLTMCYENCLNLAMKYDLHTIAFPPISTGYFGYPLREAAMIAGRTVQGWMRRHPEYGIKVYFVSADERTFAMYREILSAGK